MFENVNSAVALKRVKGADAGLMGYFTTSPQPQKKLPLVSVVG